MIPIVDDYLQLFIAEKLKWLKNHPQVIDMLFYTGKRETLTKLREFITKQKIKVLIGYPKDQASLPCYVITLAPEDEQYIGLGDEGEYYGDIDFGLGETDVEKTIAQNLYSDLLGSYMNSNYRIECWSENGDLTAYMYSILKWCLLSSRQEMIDLGWVNIKLSGTDLEPVPDYIPLFVYRRAAQVNLMYENLYFEDLDNIDKYLKIVNDPNYSQDEDGNIIDQEGNVVISSRLALILRSHYYDINTNEEYFSETKEYELRGGS